MPKLRLKNQIKTQTNQQLINDSIFNTPLIELFFVPQKFTLEKIYIDH
ncbi:hypothetical protein VEx25_A0917 [Vibrio antiquarius]|uniref:Uncharacterized protein n=2 Tax=Vibrio antiquarius (strain Ex25) TaxID=150340 RepID=A0ACA6QT87_VIBAE|nr:hypothetical protein VEA_000367 [Vibrio antiquarius]EDN58488.1 hypothetical protein VEx25_A0917 [Vibrio antiquarius]